MYKKWIIFLGLLLSTTLILSGCTIEAPLVTVTPVAVLEGTLQPYPTDTATATPLPTDYVSPTPSPTITPTATQVFYDVQAGDDMGGIGYRFGVPVSAIMTANPDVNPRAMGVGTTLLIPITPAPETTPTIEVEFTPTPTPLYKALGEPNCYFVTLGGLWCFVQVENDDEGALENISAEMVVQSGEDTRVEIAVMPLNLLPEGESLPLIAYFTPPVPENFTVTATIDFLLPVMPDDDRYLFVKIANESITKKNQGMNAEIKGNLYIEEDQPMGRYLWLQATAYDEENQIVGVRRWEFNEPISPGDKIPFKLNVYSLGGRIATVDLLAESQRVIPEPEGE